MGGGKTPSKKYPLRFDRSPNLRGQSKDSGKHLYYYYFFEYKKAAPVNLSFLSANKEDRWWIFHIIEQHPYHSPLLYHTQLYILLSREFRQQYSITKNKYAHLRLYASSILHENCFNRWNGKFPQISLHKPYNLHWHKPYDYLTQDL